MNLHLGTQLPHTPDLPRYKVPHSPPLPGWVEAWITADAQRPWPPVLPDLPADAPLGDLPR